MLDRLREIRFSGWVAPPEGGWVVVVPSRRRLRSPWAGAAWWRSARPWRRRRPARRSPSGSCTTASSCSCAGPAARRWRGTSATPPASPAPPPTSGRLLGVEGADAIAEACGRAEAGEELAGLLDEGLDPDEEIESERLSRVLGLLELPAWIVTAWVLPRRMPVGPSVKDLTRLGAGRTGVAGWLAGRAVRAVRRRRPSPLLADPPRGSAGPDDLMWL